MPHPIETSTLRILNSDGETAGTGFLVAANLAITCAHLVVDAFEGGGKIVRVQFARQTEVIDAVILEEYWRDPNDQDIAVMKIDHCPDEVSPLSLGPAAKSSIKNDLYTFGYAAAAGENGIGGLGIFIRLNDEKNLIQFRMHQADYGHSGAPLFDIGRGEVIGMVKKGDIGSDRNSETTFAIPTEIIWSVIPSLKTHFRSTIDMSPIIQGVTRLPNDYWNRIQNFLAEYLGKIDQPEPFGGRKNELNFLDRWLDDKVQRLLLVSPAGRGKSALLVRWLDQLIDRDDVELVFMPISVRFRTNLASTVFGSLAARLAYLHGEDIQFNMESSPDYWRGLFNTYLKKTITGDKKLLLVLDGLDEAGDWEATADLIPAELPKNVRIIVSARYLVGDLDPRPWLSRLGWGRKGDVVTLELNPLDPNGVADVLRHMGFPLEQLSRRVDIVKELYRLSEGDPLLVNLYVGDIWLKREEAARLQPEDLEHLQPGLDGYFVRWWSDQKKLWKTEAESIMPKVQFVLRLLSSALGPLSKNDLISLCQDFDSFLLEDVLKPLGRLIVGNGIEQGYTFCHPRLSQFFVERLTENERKSLNLRFILWGEKTLNDMIEKTIDPGQASRYLVQYYGVHLKLAENQIEKQIALILHQEWARAWFLFEGGYGGYMQDVFRVWETINEDVNNKFFPTEDGTRHLGIQFRCALIKASIQSISERIDAKLIRLLCMHDKWSNDQALSQVRSMPNSELRTRALNALLPYIKFKELYQEVLLIGEQLPSENDRASVLHTLAFYAPIELLSDIILATNRIDNDWMRVRILCVLAQRYQNAVDIAIDAIGGLNDTVKQVQAYCSIAPFSKQALQSTLNMLPDIRDERERVEILCKLVGVVSEDQFDEILVITNNLVNIRNHAEALSAMAKRWPHLGEGALLLARHVLDDDKERVQILCTLAERHQEAMDVALDAIDKMNDTPGRAQAYLSIATFSAEALQNTLDLIPDIRDKQKQAEMICKLVDIVLDDHFEELLAIANNIDSVRDRAEALSCMTKRWPQLGEVALGVTKNLVGTGKIEDDLALSNVLRVLARNSSSDLYPKILSFSTKIKDLSWRESVLEVLAERSSIITLDILLPSRRINDQFAGIKLMCNLIDIVPNLAGETIDMITKLLSGQELVNALSIIMDKVPGVYQERILKETNKIENLSIRSELLEQLIQIVPRASEDLLDTIRKNRANREISREQNWQQLVRILSKVLRAPQINLKVVWMLTWMIILNHSVDIVWYIAKILVNVIPVTFIALASLIKIVWDFVTKIFARNGVLSKGDSLEVVRTSNSTMIANCSDSNSLDWLDELINIDKLQNRASLFSDAEQALPCIKKVQHSSFAREILLAIRDVVQWWP